MLFAYFQKVLMVHHNKGLDKNAMAKALGVNPFFIQEYMAASRNYPLPKTIQVINYIHQADMYSKGIDSVASDTQILKELVFKILH